MSKHRAVTPDFSSQADCNGTCMVPFTNDFRWRERFCPRHKPNGYARWSAKHRGEPRANR